MVPWSRILTYRLWLLIIAMIGTVAALPMITGASDQLLISDTSDLEVDEEVDADDPCALIGTATLEMVSLSLSRRRPYGREQVEYPPTVASCHFRRGPPSC